jgi:hypothetical protein
MSKRAILLISIIGFLSGCMSAEQLVIEAAKARACEDAGGTAYLYFDGALEFCMTAKEQEKRDRLEFACVSAGSTVEYYRGRYSNCLGASSVRD